MPFADHDDVVQPFTSNRADHPLGLRVLPRRAVRNDGLLHVQRPGLMRKSFSIDLVSVPNQIPGPLLQRARLVQLARRPFGSRMLRDIKMQQPPPAVGQHNEPEPDSKGSRRYREEIQRDRSGAWFLKNVRHACDGGLRGPTMYFDTVA